MATTRVLIVEDQGIVAEDIESTLRELGYAVPAIALSGEGAIQRAAETQPHLVLMDIRLSGEMDGIAAAEEIRARFDIPVVYLTGYADQEIVQRAKLTEPFGYIVKPFEPRELQSAIEVALYKHEMERRLRESEERYRSLFEGVPVGLYRTTPEGQILDVNPALLETLGFPDRETALAVNAASGYVNPEDRARWQALMDREGVVRDFQAQWHRRDGTIVWAEESARAVRDDEGRVLYYEGIVEDITERKRAEERLRLHSGIMVNMAEGAYLVRASDGVIVYANPTFEEVFGYGPGEMVGKHVSVVNAPTEKTPEETAKEIMGILDRTGVWHGEVNNIKKDGTPFWCYASVSAFDHPEHGRVLVAVHTDITERKRAEEALHKERDFAESLVETAQTIVLVLDTEGRIIRFNPYMQEISGHRLEEVQGKDWFATFLPKRDRERIRQLFLQAIGDIHTRGNVNPIITKDGREREIEWYDETLKDVEGNAIGLLAIGQDITERKRAKEALQQAYEDSLRRQEAVLNLTEDLKNTIEERKRAEEQLRQYREHLEELVNERTAELRRTNEELEHEITERKQAEEGQRFALAAKEEALAEALQATHALRESEQRYRTLVDLAPEMIYLLDPDGKIVFVSRGAEELGYAADELLGKRFEEIVHPDDIEAKGGFVERRIGERATRDLEIRLLTKHGEVRDHAARSVEAAVSVRGLWDVPDDEIEQSQKTFLGTLGIVRDITERKRAEEALQEAYDELERRVEERTIELSRANEELMTLNAIAVTLSESLDLDQMLDATLDRVLDLLGIDAGWIQLLDEDTDEGSLVAHRGLPRVMIEAASATKWRAGVAGQVAQTGQPIVVSKTSEDPWFSPETGGLEALHSFAGVPIQSRDKAQGVLGVFSHFLRQPNSRDVQLLTAIGHQIGGAVENARLAEEAAEIEILQELDRLRSELIANVSHELRTPLGLIKIFSTCLLIEDAELDQEIQREFLHNIGEEADKLQRIVDNLLDLSGLESGRLRLDKYPADLGQLAGEVIEAMKVEMGIQATRQRFVHDFPADPLVAAVDARRLEQVLRNLLSNAVKYSPEGGTITVQGNWGEGQILVSVSDQGIGIPSEDVERVFERFYRVENASTQSTRGAGLGLAVCRGIVEAHGGRIWVESTLSEESTIYFTLPTES